MESRLLNRNEQHAEALQRAQAAHALYLKNLGNQNPKTARANLFVAREYRELDREKEAIPLILESLRTYESLGDIKYVAICHHQLSLCNRKLYLYREARQEEDAAIRILRPDSLKGWYNMALFYLSSGSLFNTESNFSAAIPILESTRAVFTATKDSLSLAFAYYHLGDAYFGLHDFERAKEQYLSSWANLQHQMKSGHSYFADLNVKLAYCFQKNGEADIGLEKMREAKAIYLKSGAGTEDLNYIKFLQYLGRFYLEEKQYAAAIAQITACLEAKEKQFGTRSTNLLNTLQVLGDAYTRAGDYARAETVLQRAIGIIADSLLNSAEVAFPFYLEMAKMKLAQTDYASCENLCNTAFVMAGGRSSHTENPVFLHYAQELNKIYAQCLMGQYHQTRQLPLLQNAVSAYALSAQLLFQALQNISNNGTQENFYDDQHSILEQWLDAQMEWYAVTCSPDIAEAAFRTASAGKAFLLTDAMQKSGALNFAGVPDSLLQQESSLRERIAEAEKKLNVFSGEHLPEEQALWLNQVLANWRNDYDVLLSNIKNNYPEYYRLRTIPKELSSQQIRADLLAPDQAMVQYSQTTQGWYVFVLSRDTFYVGSLPMDSTTLGAMHQFRSTITAYHTAANPGDDLYDQSLDEYLRLAPLLYQALVGPIAALLPKRVLIVPDGILNYLPFEALLTAAPKDAGNFCTYPFWSRDKAISYALSPNYLMECRQPMQKYAEKPWLGVAPFAQAGGSAKPGYPAFSKEAAQLVASGQEVSAIAAMMGGDRWLGTAAWPGRFEAEAAQYRMLHLATHSRADDRQGDYSYLLPSPTGPALPAKDLYQMSLAAEMVVLSACEAGAGKLIRGEGIIGLVRAFTYAGARSIVASIWVANDQSTADIMVDFYANLKNGMPKDIALQTARLHVIQQSPAQAHPFYWSGFRVFGNVAPITGLGY
ncbi:MAG: CHAT domain-containing protein [Lewinellaceae bacterium]|nr:CHAT domain-containing protein [Lewinellaceae bacterium]